MAYAMFLNLFLHGAEAFKEYYSDTEHLLYTRYWFQGLGRAPHAGAVRVDGGGAERRSRSCCSSCRAARRNWLTLNLGCLATYAGCYIEKGMGLIIPGLTPDTLGEIYEYAPSITELRVAAGVFAVGFLVFTLMLQGGGADLARRVPGRGGARAAGPRAARSGSSEHQSSSISDGTRDTASPVPSFL